MRVAEICRRLAAELRSPDIRGAGLKQAYYPAPGVFNEWPAAVVFPESGPNEEAMGEQVWLHRIRVQVMVPDGRDPRPSLNALDGLLEPIADHFAPGTAAYRLTVPGQPGMVHRCALTEYLASQAIQYAGLPYLGWIYVFDVKAHRLPGEA